MQTLDERLSAIAGFVRRGSRIADVGCDHGLLITALLSEGVISGGVACDINEQPLQKARLRVEDLGLSAQISCRLCDGLSGVAAGEVQDIVIAGMGGELIFDILTRCDWAKEGEKRFILQPMTKLPALRQSLLSAGYEILSERGCHAQGKDYTVLWVRYCGEPKFLDLLDPYVYIGELGQNPSPAAKAVVRHASSALRKRAAGIALRDKALSERLTELVATLDEKVKDW